MSKLLVTGGAGFKICVTNRKAQKYIIHFAEKRCVNE